MLSSINKNRCTQSEYIDFFKVNTPIFLKLSSPNTSIYLKNPKKRYNKVIPFYKLYNFLTSCGFKGLYSPLANPSVDTQPKRTRLSFLTSYPKVSNIRLT